MQGAFASQGQLRALVLAWKTAELALLGEVLGELPILLLDDVSSELDESRNTASDRAARRISADTSPTAVLVVPTDEELAIARACVQVIED